MGREFELKYRATPEIIEKIRDKFQDFTSITMETTYYDTPDGDFSRLRCTLRRRWENGVGVCTLKTPAPDGSRGEWEVSAEEITEGVRLLSCMGVPVQLETLAAKGLERSCGAAFTRLAKTIVLAGATVELALDQGLLLGGDRELPFAEVEVEWKEGSEEAAVSFARSLAAEFSLVEEHSSKYKRAVSLARNHI